MISPGIVYAELLPVISFTTSDGLPHNLISQVVSDSRGFLWFATAGGLSRFDGYTFTNYGLADGLPHRVINDIREDASGAIWVATEGGLCRFNPAAAGARFAVYYPSDSKNARSITALYEDRSHRLWCGTMAGLYQVVQNADKAPSFRFVDLHETHRTIFDRVVTALYQDRRGVLWAGMGDRVYRLLGDGRVENYSIPGTPHLNVITQFLEDRRGWLWMGSRAGLFRLDEQPDPSRAIVIRRFSTKDGLRNDWVNALIESSDGAIWGGTASGLSRFIPSEAHGAGSFRTYTVANGLADAHITAMAEDRQGNLWLGSDTGGAMKIARNGFTTYNAADALAGLGAQALFEDRTGELCAVTIVRQTGVNCFDGSRFHLVHPNYGRPVKRFGWSWYQTTFQDHAGEWWVPTGEGLFRFPSVPFRRLSRKLPKAMYSVDDGLASGEAFRVYEDSRGDIWIGPITLAETWLSRWERATGRFHHYKEADGVPRGWASAFAEAPQGVLWVGFYEGRVARYSSGRFQQFTPADGFPQNLGVVRALHRDRAERLWIAGENELVLVTDPAAQKPHFMAFHAAQYLSGGVIRCLTEDAWGRIYVGTGRGIDRLDPGPAGALPRVVRHYSSADGLASGTLNVAICDHGGDLWFSTSHGLCRFTPQPDPPRPKPRVLITALRIRGELRRISVLGESEMRGIQLQPHQNQVQIDFLGLDSTPGEPLRYQYMLDGADSDWSAPSGLRTVNYASLAPGAYRFMVRAVNSDGALSPKPASIEFILLAPLWQRWWFRVLAVVLCALAIYGLYRYRVDRLLELERIRTRIATDLHDDIGSSLSQIAILSEVLTHQTDADNVRLTEPLSRIAGISRELVASMSDIVWAINPRHDQLDDLTQRMRRFASDVLTARNIGLEFRAPSGATSGIKLGADIRREVFLIFKESVNNIARHSGCTHAHVDFSLTPDRLVLTVGDDGRGLDPTANNGHGLVNMRARAAKIRGQFAVESAPGDGARITLQVPLTGSGIRSGTSHLNRW